MNELVKNSEKVFQEKLIGRIREDIRDLMPEEVITGLIERAIQEEFFKPRLVEDGRWDKRYKPSEFVEEVIKAAQPILQAAVSDFVSANGDMIKTAVTGLLKKEAVAIILGKMIGQEVSAGLSMVANAITNRR
jgi:hypothetical protein